MDNETFFHAWVCSPTTFSTCGFSPQQHFSTRGSAPRNIFHAWICSPATFSTCGFSPSNIFSTRTHTHTHTHTHLRGHARACASPHTIRHGRCVLAVCVCVCVCVCAPGFAFDVSPCHLDTLSPCHRATMSVWQPVEPW